MTVHLGARRQIEHTLKANGGVVGVGFFTNETGPHGVVEFGEMVLGVHGETISSPNTAYATSLKRIFFTKPKCAVASTDKAGLWNLRLYPNPSPI